MKIDEFVRMVQEQDNTNLFSTYAEALDMVPVEMQSFYTKYNPSSVAIGYNGTTMHMIPAERLEKENEYYGRMNIGFVFATCDGDPVFYIDGKVYTCPHGVKNPKWELLAESFEEYLGIIINR